jgi:hypothetical protein
MEGLHVGDRVYCKVWNEKAHVLEKLSGIITRLFERDNIPYCLVDLGFAHLSFPMDSVTKIDSGQDSQPKRQTGR